MCDLDEEELLEGIGDAVLGIGACDEVSPTLDVFGGITHSDPCACQFDHLEVVVVVSDGDEVLRRLPEDLEEASEGAALIDSEGDELEEEVTERKAPTRVPSCSLTAASSGMSFSSGPTARHFGRLSVAASTKLGTRLRGMPVMTTSFSA